MPKQKPDYSARFYAWLDGPPMADDDRTHAAAAAYLARIVELLEMDGKRIPNDTGRYGGAAGALIEWTKNEKRNLLRLRARWRRRAAGDDPRWEKYGDRPGRAIVDPTWAEPLAYGEVPPPVRGHHAYDRKD
jgi:hypothetical protein